MPDQVRSVLVEGLKLFELERVRQARLMTKFHMPL